MYIYYTKQQGDNMQVQINKGRTMTTYKVVIDEEIMTDTEGYFVEYEDRSNTVVYGRLTISHVDNTRTWVFVRCGKELKKQIRKLICEKLKELV